MWWTPPLASQPKVLYRSPAFTVTDSSVRQGPFEAVADTSRDTVRSSYPRAAREVHFRFSLNGLDNEFRPGTEHTINLRPRVADGGRVATPVYTFGVEGLPYVPTPEESAGGDEGTAQVTFRLDLRPALRAFAARGYYDPPLGQRVRAADFAGVYVIGDARPLAWDVRALRPGVPQQLTDADGDSVYTATLAFGAEYSRPLGTDGRALWARRHDLSAYPRLASPQPLLDALYRLSLDELRDLVRDDGALSAGARWPGVWTRDVSFAGVLALAVAAPEALRASLLARVDSSGRVVQDTGTGGSWPVSTDRTVWALAAWELYAATGDEPWLLQAYRIVSRSVEADLHAARDAASGLFRGESSFLDWREQSHPRWMQPADIYQSQALGTNAVHYATYRLLGTMARALGEPDPARWDAIADGVRRGMHAHLWQPALGYFGQYRYGRNAMSLSPRAEGLGEALAVIYGAASPAQRALLARRAPAVPFGVPSFWPYIPDVPRYHNATIWPFVTAYGAWAAAEAGNTAAVEHGLAGLWRAAALFLTNKENVVAATGHFEGTALNSDRQLWSVAGTLAATYRVLFGMRLHADRLAFRPMVPPAYAGERTLSNLRYRRATLTVTVRGHGDGVARARLDGRPVSAAEVPATLAGAHTLELDLNGRWPAAELRVAEHRATPATPRAVLRGDTLVWSPVAGAARYQLSRDGRPGATVADTTAPVVRGPVLAEYQVAAVDATGMASFLSEPVRVALPGAVQTVSPPTEDAERAYAGFSGAGYLTLSSEQHTRVAVPVRVAQAGTYAVDVRYANGSGPVSTDDMAAVRTLLVDGREAGVVVMPHRGPGVWTDWGYSNPVRVRLGAGAHTLVLAYTALDQNMNRRVNTALLDHVRVTRVGP